jgi:hypothetical protein
MAHYNSVLRLRRQHTPVKTRTSVAPTASQTEEDRPSLLTSPVFWIGGLLSIAAWIGIAKVLGAF